MKKSLLILIMALLLSPAAIFAQAKASVQGTITDDQTGETLVGATVIVKGTTTGSITDLSGNYAISNLNAGTYTLEASYVGYSSMQKTVTITTGQNAVVDFKLKSSAVDLNQVVVTGVVNPKSALESSIAITSIKPKALQSLSANNTAEVFKAIPGIHSEATGGEGNANISVRGIPISTGGSKFLQLHEDGLPVLQFGDIIFGNADMFVRTDQSIARIEAVRGGSASTFASNSPAGIINFISKTGAIQGGTIGVSTGLDYNEFRTDFDFGAPIGNGFSFNIGGFYRQGEGARNCGFNGNQGGQIKANLTKQFDKGYVRVYLKHLDDKAISYMPMPIIATGTGLAPTYTSIEGFDIRNATFQNTEFFNMAGIDAAGNPRTTNINDGMHPVSNAIGTEFSFDLGDGWKVMNKNRLALTNGSFRTLFPTGLIGSADDVAKAILPATAYASGYNFSYANGANAATALTSTQLSGLNGNGLLMQLASFDVDINSFNNFTNDLNLSKDFKNVKLTLGYYNAFQQIATYWNWQGYITDVSATPKLMNVMSTDGTFFTEGGVTNYGIWGLGRKYDMMYKINAPYADIAFDVNKKINIDASIRYDFGNAYGYYLTSKSTAVDVNSNGSISPVESACNVVDNSKTNSVNYDYSYLSFSVGANYKMNDNAAAYGRVSRGGRANADRLLYSSFITPEGKTMAGLEADMVTQVEFGYKYSSPKYAVMVTPYFSTVEEQNADITENKIYLVGFRSYGVELEGTAKLGNFTATAGAVFTKATITKSLDENEVGNTPRRVPLLMYNFNPSYSIGNFDLGLSFIGTTKVYSQNDNKIVLPAYVYMNAFAGYSIAKGLAVSVNINNVFNAMGLTEAEGTTFVDNATNYMRARSITGRTSKLSITYNF